MKKLWRKIKDFLDDKGLIKILTPIIVLVIALVVLPHIVGAADPETVGGKVDEIKQDLVATIVTFQAFLQALLAPMIMIASGLMDNSILLDPAMESKILQIWVEIRNWVNIIFVLALVFIALYNVLGIAGDGSNYALKAILPKIVIGLVAINFSFLGGKILIDSVGLLTNAVYSLPANFVAWDQHVDDLRVRLCTNYKETTAENGTKSWIEETRLLKDASVLGVIFCEKQEGADPSALTGQFNAAGTSYFEHFGEHNATATIMVNMGLITDADMVDFKEGDAVDALSKLALHSLFGIFMFLLFGFAFAALICVLVARLVILWICLALSPVIVLFFVFPDLASSAGGGELDLKDKFFKHLFVPLVIGVVFSVGFTMLSVLYNSESGSFMDNLGLVSETTGDPLTFDDLINEGGDSTDVIEMVEAFGKDATDFQDLLIAVSAVLIIWIGVFAAADQTVASSFTGSIKEAGKKLGSFAAKMPLYLTTIPVPGVEGGTSLGGLLGAPGEIISSFESKMRQQSRDLAQSVIPTPIGRQFDKAKDAIKGEPNTPDKWKAFENNYLKFQGSKDDKGKLEELLREVDPAVLAAYNSKDGSVDEKLKAAATAAGISSPNSSSWGQTPLSSKPSATTSDDTATTEPSAPSALKQGLAGVSRGTKLGDSGNQAVSAQVVTALQGHGNEDVSAIQQNQAVKDVLGDNVSDEMARVVQQFGKLSTEQQTQIVGQLEVSNGHIQQSQLATSVRSTTPPASPPATTSSASTTMPATGTPGGTGQGTNPDATTPDPTTPLEDEDPDPGDNR